MLTQAFRSFSAAKKPLFNITSAAAREITNRLKADFENKMFRVNLKYGGPAGLIYDFGFDSKAKSDDNVFVKDGAKVVLDNNAMDYLKNSTLDFASDSNSSSFKIVLPTKPNVHWCTCGNRSDKVECTCFFAGLPN